MQNFWDSLAKPFFVLAPMEDVTDAAFRRLIAAKGKPAVMFTEFTSADGLVLAPQERQGMLRKKLLFCKEERPIVAQLFSANPERMEKGAMIAQELGFDGVDINMGCPVNEVVSSGCGAALIKNHPLARELIRAAKRGAPNIPVSVKTRIGYNEDELDTWLPELLAEEPVVVTIHARTRKDMSLVPARWEKVKKSVDIRNALGSKTLIVGNGDAKDIADARTKVLETNCDGVMLARAIYGNPWLFDERKESPTPPEKMQALIDHLLLFDELLSETTNFAVMKKHFKAYISGWDNAKIDRVRLMEVENLSDAVAILEAMLLTA